MGRVAKVGIAATLGTLLIVAGAAALTFKEREFTVASTGYGVVTGDFTEDGKRDVLDIGSPDLYLLEARRGGRFKQPVTIDWGGTSAWGGAAGRFNGDQHLDVVVASKATDEIVLLRGNGDGTFMPPLEFSVGSSPQSPAAADFNLDGRLDVAVANNGEPSISVRYGTPGGFEPPDGFQVGGNPYAVATGRLNKDRRPDLVSADDAGDSFSVLIAKAGGVFKPVMTKETPVGFGPEDVAIGDLNRDGKGDVVTANYAAGSVSVFRGKGDGTFRKPKTKAAGGATWHVAVGDINHDGKPDVAAGNEDPSFASVFLGRGDGRLRRQKKIGIGEENSQVAIAQLDRRRGADVVVGGDDGAVVIALSRP